MGNARKTTKKLDTGYHDRRLAQLLQDPEFEAEFHRQKRAIEAIDAIVNRLDELRVKHGYSKAELARMIDKNPATVRRWLTSAGNPELANIVAMADALDADVVLVPRTRKQRAIRHEAVPT